MGESNIYCLSQPRSERVLILLIPFLLLVSLTFSLYSADKKPEVPLKEDLFSVTFPAGTDGWACGRFGTVLHTSDGGKTWVRQDTQTDYTLSSIHFTDNKNGWAVGDEGAIIHTEDGGKT